MTGENIDNAYWFIENFMFWKSSERTLFLLNGLFLTSFLLLGLVFFQPPIRYGIAASIWMIPASNSDFVRRLGQSLVKIIKSRQG